MKRLLWLGWLASILVLSALGANPKGVGANEAPRLLVAHGFGGDHPVQRGLELFRKHLAGVVAVGIETRGDDGEAVGAILAGNLGGGVVSPTSLRNLARGVTLLDLIGLWRDRNHWTRALNGETGRQLAAMVERATKGRIIVLGYWGGTRRHLLTRTGGVSGIKGVKNLRLGIPLNPIQSKIWKALGAHPVFLRRADTFSALRQGTVEGVEGDAATMLHERLYEVAPHLTETGHAIATRLFIVNGKAWRRLAESERKAVRVAAKEATNLARKAEINREMELISLLRDRQEVSINRFQGRDALISLTRPIRHRYSEELGALKILLQLEQSGRE